MAHVSSYTHRHTHSLTNTDGAGNVGGVSGVTDALVGALCVHTSSVLTQIPHHLTLINICTKHMQVLSCKCQVCKRGKAVYSDRSGGRIKGLISTR